MAIQERTTLAFEGVVVVAVDVMRGNSTTISVRGGRGLGVPFVS